MNDLERDKQLSRIMAFELDTPNTSLPFTSRLAREQNWTHAFAQRVVQEYKRFIGLAMFAGHPVTPSEDVDQVWHLHLVYTKSYWQDLCRDILGQELHHQPTVGGSEEGAKFHDWYSKTLESYLSLYSQPAPRDIWPSPVDRFKNAGSGRWIDSSKFWLVPRPGFLRLFKSWRS